MPMVDFSLSELKKYKGINPKPQDFDEFWEKALTEMRSVDANVTIKPAEYNFPNTECFHLYFTGVRGARIHAKYLRPKNAKEKMPAIVMLHGYSDNCGDFSDKLNFVHAGYSVFAMDCRGQAGLSQDVGGVVGTTYHGHIIRGIDDKPENLMFRQIFLDAAQLAGIAINMDNVDENNVMVTGGSQGGGLTVACAALEPRISKIAFAFPFLSDYKRVWEMDLDKNAYEEIAYYFRRFDPLHEHETEFFTKLGYIDIKNLAPRIKAKALMCATLVDTICPPSTQFATYNNLTCEKQVLIYPDYAHETPKGWNDKSFAFLTQDII